MEKALVKGRDAVLGTHRLRSTNAVASMISIGRLAARESSGGVTDR